ncbi:thioredoxin family protein [Cellulophaga sp. HaHaR_3_176]|uniref:thioredoxin family protein n=1 Tax=Cellulophaga sp. HaHaR_3_176 TaxID=1942464 RepID=UPI001C1FBB75|nr:thioredoxin family protein [Cellulophaga sp. HaHaR_3_176]
MKKSNLFLIAALLVCSFMTISNVNAQDRKGRPANGEHKGPPSGGHNPEQSESLSEMTGYKIGDKATDFELKNVDGLQFSLSDIEDAKGYIVVFTCNECPFAKMYEDRLISLHQEYAPKGYSVVAINPNVSATNERESYEAMQKRANEKDFPFVYLADTDQKIVPQYGALRTPHVFLLDAELTVQYIGTIDDNAKNAKDVKVKYVENAIQALENGEKPNPNFTKSIGCPVKFSK